jgi:hypothetical protein
MLFALYWFAKLTAIVMAVYFIILPALGSL